MTATFVPIFANSVAINIPIPLQPPVTKTTSWLLTNFALFFQLLRTHWESLLFTARRTPRPRRTFRPEMKRSDVTTG